MPRDPRPTDVPSLLPAQIASLENGVVAVRGRRGLALLRGARRADLDRVLALIDGERTVGEICDALADDCSTEDVLRCLWQLEGDAVRCAPPAPARSPASALPEMAASRVAILGEGGLAQELAEVFGGSPASALDELARVLARSSDDPKLVICALEEVSYRELFDVQTACLDAGVACLFVTCDPDGTRLGPTVIPGASPCFACAQAASLRALRVPATALPGTLAGFQTGRLDPAVRELVVEEIVRETRTVLGPEPRAALATTVVLHSVTAGRTAYPVAPIVDCPLCGEREAAAHPLAEQARSEVVASYRRQPRVAARDDDTGFSVGVIGGGTAGYLGALALRRRFPRLPVTLIESSDVPVIGVGEATTPLMPQFLHVDLGLDVGELFREVQPTFKLGIRFEWGRPGGAFNYPFGPVHVLEPLAFGDELDDGSPRSLLMNAGALPLFRDGWHPDGSLFRNGWHPEDGHPEDGAFRDGWHPGSRFGWHSALDVDTAYHLDNRRFVGYLRRQAARRGVTMIDARIQGVELDGDGESVTGLLADDGRRFAFDLYLDCTGFRSLLLERSLGSPWRSYRDSLLTDRALIGSVPLDGPVAPYTLARTLGAGWCWSTPQREEDHRGYVFSSAFATPEQAEVEMRALCPGLGETRLIEFRAGRHEHFWRGNVIALGNAYGFVEPLESTALHMLIRQIGLLLGALPVRRGERGVPELLNRRASALWDYLAWFLALHYRFNRRLETPFWKHCRDHVDVSRHGELLDAFRERGPLSYQRALSASFDYPDPLWGAEGIDVVLLGQGVPTRLPRPLTSSREWDRRRRLYQRSAKTATPQRQALAVFDREPHLLRRWIQSFERVGPAFR